MKPLTKHLIIPEEDLIHQITASAALYTPYWQAGPTGKSSGKMPADVTQWTQEMISHILRGENAIEVHYRYLTYWQRRDFMYGAVEDPANRRSPTMTVYSKLTPELKNKLLQVLTIVTANSKRFELEDLVFPRPSPIA